MGGDVECGGWLGVYVCTGEGGGCLDSAWVFNCAEVGGGVIGLGVVLFGVAGGEDCLLCCSWGQ